ncbi:hypothetical protein BC831DRAFT_472634, partial [Entophlyctis helioformis]
MVEITPDGQREHSAGAGDDSSNEAQQEEEQAFPRAKRQRTQQPAAMALRGLYLETINRARLDFDFEKLCSVSLSNINVYACLVCGKYYQGRGKQSHAYFHSMNEDHHVFINLETLGVYILPDGYEVDDPSLGDIKYVDGLDSSMAASYDLNNKMYLPGFVGLNNIKANDYINVVVQALSHVKMVRDHFLLETSATGSELVDRFGMLVRKMWNRRSFKGQVSPHELIQEIANASQKRFRLGEQCDVSEFLSWFVNTLHRGLIKKRRSGRVRRCMLSAFQGELRVETETVLRRETGTNDALDQEEVVAESRLAGTHDAQTTITTTVTPFWFLALEPPPAPLFTDEADKNIIPQVPLVTLLAKYDGKTPHHSGSTIKRFKISKLPPYLIFCIKRFSKNNWLSTEKNPTIVNFPIKGLDMSEYTETGESARYDLVANICHEGRPGPGNGVYKVHLLSKGKDQWFQIQDLFVEEIVAQMILLAETYVQVWERVA